jgi:hypothetical protein
MQWVNDLARVFISALYTGQLISAADANRRHIAASRISNSVQPLLAFICTDCARDFNPGLKQ